MDEKTKKEFMLIFNQGFEEVILPQIVKLEGQVKKGFKKINSKLDSIERRIDDQAIKSGDNERRIKKLESKHIMA